MSSSNNNIAVILAAGKGVRAGLDVPKQFAVVAGKTVLEHAIAPFQKSNLVHEIYIVTNPEFFPRVQNIVQHNNFNKVTQIVAGGTERYLSTLAALNAIQSNTPADKLKHCRVIIHDSARILVSTNIIQQCIMMLSRYQAVTTGSYASDTIVVAPHNPNNPNNSERIIGTIPDRNSLIAVQTPQCFHINTLIEGYKHAIADTNINVTDDCGIISKYMPHINIAVAITTEPNNKLTTKNDLILLQTLIK